MRKLPLLLLAFLFPFAVFATPTSWDFSSGVLQPLQSMWTAVVKGDHFVATSTQNASVFPYASTTAISSSNLVSGKCVQAGTGGLLTTTGSACGSGSGGITEIDTTYPILGGPITTTGTLTFGGLTTTTPWNPPGVAWAVDNNHLSTIATGTVSNGAGISVTAGQSILGSGLVITNTSPDQMVVLNAGDGISVSSAYPNFTIYNPFAIATDTSNFSQGNLTYLEQASGKTKLGSVATTTLSGSGVISVTNGATVIGGSPITVSCATCASTANNIATTSTISIPQVAYFTKTGGVTTIGGAATTSFSVSGPFNIANAIGVLNNGTVVYWGLSTTSALTQGQVLYNTTGGNGVASAATSTPTAVDLTILGSGATIGSLQVNNPFAIATTSGIAQGQLPYYTQTSGKTTIGGVATNTISGSGVISVTAGASVISGSPITVSCATCGTGSGTVTSVTAGNDLLAATNPITTTGTINAQVGTSSVPTIPSLSYWTSVGSASNPARLGSVATSSVSAGTGITFSGTAGALVGGTSLTINGTDIYRIATTSDIAVPNLAYFTKTGGVTTLGSAATTSATINNGLTGTLTTIGGSQTIGLATINAGVLGAVVNSAVPTSQATSTLYGVAPAGGYVLGWDNTKNGINWIATSTGGGGTVSSVAVGSGLSASPSPIKTTGTIYNPFAIATSSTLFALSGSVYVSQVSGMTTLASAATSTPTGVGITLAGTGATIGALQINNPFAIATTSDVAISGLATYTKVSGMTTLGNTSTSTLTASGPLTGSFTQIGSGGALGCTTAASGVGGCLSSTAFDTFNNKLGSYDAWTHTVPGISATTSYIGIGSSTPRSQLSVSTSTQTSEFNSLFAVASTTNTTLFNVLGGGNVGVGTTTPGTLFSIQGSANFTSGTSTILGNGLSVPHLANTALTAGRLVAVGAGGYEVNATVSTGLTLSAANALTVNTSQNISTLSNLTTDGVIFTSGANGTLNVDTGALDIVRGGTATTTFYNGGVTFFNSTLGTLSQGTAALDFFYDVTNKKLGLGTSTPFGRLSINADVLGTAPALAIGSTTSTSFVVDNGGKVGVGTTSPGTLFSINGSANFTTATSTILGNGLTVPNLSVTNGTSGRLLGFGAGGYVQNITVGTGLSLSGGTLSAAGGGTTVTPYSSTSTTYAAVAIPVVSGDTVQAIFWASRNAGAGCAGDEFGFVAAYRWDTDAATTTVDDMRLNSSVSTGGRVCPLSDVLTLTATTTKTLFLESRNANGFSQFRVQAQKLH